VVACFTNDAALGGPFLAKSRYHIARGHRKTACSPVLDPFVRLQKPLLNDDCGARRSICAFSAVEGIWAVRINRVVLRWFDLSPGLDTSTPNLDTDSWQPAQNWARKGVISGSVKFERRHLACEISAPQQQLSCISRNRGPRLNSNRAYFFDVRTLGNHRRRARIKDVGGRPVVF